MSVNSNDMCEVRIVCGRCERQLTITTVKRNELRAIRATKRRCIHCGRVNIKVEILRVIKTPINRFSGTPNPLWSNSMYSSSRFVAPTTIGFSDPLLDMEQRDSIPTVSYSTVNLGSSGHCPSQSALLWGSIIDNFLNQ